MTDLDDMEKSMGKALKEVRRKQLGVDALIALASFAGGLLGIGWAAHAYLGGITGKVDQIATLNLAQAEQLKSLTDSNTKAHERVAACEKLQAVDERAFIDLKERVRDIELRSGTIVQGRHEPR